MSMLGRTCDVPGVQSHTKKIDEMQWRSHAMHVMTRRMLTHAPLARNPSRTQARSLACKPSTEPLLGCEQQSEMQLTCTLKSPSVEFVDCKSFWYWTPARSSPVAEALPPAPLLRRTARFRYSIVRTPTTTATAITHAAMTPATAPPLRSLFKVPSKYRSPRTSWIIRGHRQTDYASK
jgi:hypothetical protein